MWKAAQVLCCIFILLIHRIGKIMTIAFFHLSVGNVLFSALLQSSFLYIIFPAFCTTSSFDYQYLSFLLLY